MKLIGVDVGFSNTRPTTGIACLDEERLFLARAETTWAKRETVIPHGFRPSIIAFDGPLLPEGANELTRREPGYRHYYTCRQMFGSD